MSSTADVLVAPVPDPGLRTVLLPKWRTALARAREERPGTPLKLLLLAWSAAGFWSAVFGVAYRVLLYFRSEPEIGSSSPRKMLGVILLAFASILLLSNLVTALSTFFLAKDLDMLVAAPVDWLRLYLAKLGETVVHSSWMVALLAVPILTAYGIVYHGGPVLARGARGASCRSCCCPAVIGAVVTLHAGERLSRPAHPRPAEPRGLGGAGGVVLLLRVHAARAAGASRRVPQPGRLPRRAADPDQPVPAERVGGGHHHELAHPGGRSAADRAALDHRRRVRRAGRAAAQAALPARLHQGAGRRRAVRAGQELAPVRVAAAGPPAGGRSASSSSRMCGCSSATRPSGAS